MSRRMLTDSERKTLETLKKKAKFENDLINGTSRTIIELGDDTPETTHKKVRHWFLNESRYWKKKNLTESEFDHALKLLREQLKPRGVQP